MSSSRLMRPILELVEAEKAAKATKYGNGESGFLRRKDQRILDILLNPSVVVPLLIVVHFTATDAVVVAFTTMVAFLPPPTIYM
ncbi:hypothetical protein VNO77_23718 [Canavalia gladiata]|uniref:Uncharacterized protein n=1 Tax=Canavalia gladiata TaxID=3824 RepID=A0AAN9L8A0_CANGL